jgi:hypothetical protein
LQALEARKFSAASDCWSYGVVLFEIWTRGELPYNGMSNQKVWVDVASGKSSFVPDRDHCAYVALSLLRGKRKCDVGSARSEEWVERWRRKGKICNVRDTRGISVSGREARARVFLFFVFVFLVLLGS